MSLYVLDTDTLQLFQDQNPLVVARVLAVAPADLATSVISVEEQLSGWYAQLRQAKQPERLAWAYRRLAATVRFLTQVQIVDFDEAAIQRCEQLSNLKLNVRKMDLRIAAIVLERDAILVTRNVRDFQRIPALRIEDWSTSADPSSWRCDFRSRIAFAFSASSTLIRPSPSVSILRNSSSLKRNSLRETSPSRLRSILRNHSGPPLVGVVSASVAAAVERRRTAAHWDRRRWLAGPRRTFQLVAARQCRLAEVALACAVELLQQLRRLPHLADAEPAVAVGVQQVEQAAALVGELQRHAAGRDALLQLVQVIEIGEHFLLGQLAVAVAVHRLEQGCGTAGLAWVSFSSRIAVAVLVGLAGTGRWYCCRSRPPSGPSSCSRRCRASRRVSRPGRAGRRCP